MKDFFRTANRLFPIFLESSFMKMVEWQYTQQTCDDAARWASINMVICLAYEYRSSNSHKSEKDKERAELYFKNAMSVFTELALKRTDLLSIQALISMVCPFSLWPLFHVLTCFKGFFPPWKRGDSISSPAHYCGYAFRPTNGASPGHCKTGS
jgi:hypothetical protein